LQKGEVIPDEFWWEKQSCHPWRRNKRWGEESGESSGRVRGKNQRFLHAPCGQLERLDPASQKFWAENTGIEAQDNEVQGGVGTQIGDQPARNKTDDKRNMEDRGPKQGYAMTRGKAEVVSSSQGGKLTRVKKEAEQRRRALD